MKNRKSQSGRCNAITNSGTQCKRASLALGKYCKQHAAMIKASLWGHHGVLDYVPDPPPVLSKDAAGYWHQYCRVLLSHNKLKGHYLNDLFELCWRIDKQKVLQEDVDDHGFFTKYPSGRQITGTHNIIDKNDKRITELKKQFGLTLDSESRLTVTKSAKSGNEKGKSNLKSINGKDW